MRGKNVKQDRLYPVCNKLCASKAGLNLIEVHDEVIFPQSCSHCYNCGVLVDGGLGTWCAFDEWLGREPGAGCPEFDATSTRLYQETAMILSDSCQITDEIWKMVYYCATRYSYLEPEVVAKAVLDTRRICE